MASVACTRSRAPQFDLGALTVSILTSNGDAEATTPPRAADVLAVDFASLPQLPELVAGLLDARTSLVGTGRGARRRCFLSAACAPPHARELRGLGVVVLCADPRCLAMSRVLLDGSTEEDALAGALEPRGLFAEAVGQVAAWAELASESSRCNMTTSTKVQICLEDTLSNCPSTTIGDLADFLGVSKPPMGELTAFLEGDGALVERFSQCLRYMPGVEDVSFESLLAPWLASSHAELASYGRRLLAECCEAREASLRFRERHEEGQCEPCVFALRSSCRNGAACGYCHLEGHQKPKRASKRKREKRKERIRRMYRTPSPSWNLDQEASTNRRGASPLRRLPQLQSQLGYHWVLQPAPWVAVGPLEPQWCGSLW